MATIDILVPESAQVADTLRVVAFIKNDLGAPVDAATVTYALYDLATDQWWDAIDLAWEAVRVENATAQPGPAGVYAAPVDLASANPAATAREWLVFVTCDAPALQGARPISLRHGLSTFPVADAAVPANVTTLGALLTLLRVVHSHDQSVDDIAKQLVFFRADGQAAALRFDLKDAAGNASVREPFRRERA